jgi:TolB protein
MNSPGSHCRKENRSEPHAPRPKPDNGKEKFGMNRRPVLGLALAGGALLSAVLLPGPSQASPSAVNGRIAFSAQVHRVSQVFTIKPDGTGLYQLTSGDWPAGQFGLTWTPDGRSLLWTVTDAAGIDKMVTGVRGGGRVVSPPCTGTCLGDDDPDYSPDGKKIAFERAFGPIVRGNASLVAIFTMNADGGQLTQLTRPTNAEDHQPQWSPDGKKIAFVRSGSKGAIEMMNADGSNLRRLTPYRIDASDPRWSPDGKRILFNTYAEATPGKSANLFTMRANGTHRVALTHYKGGTLQAFACDWSPDGTRILLRRMRYSGTNTEIGDFYILNLHNKHVIRLTHAHISYDAQATWGRRPD